MDHFHPPVDIRFQIVGENHDIEITFLNNKETFEEGNGVRDYVPETTTIRFRQKDIGDSRDGLVGIGVAQMLQTLLQYRDQELIPFAKMFRILEPEAFAESLKVQEQRQNEVKRDIQEYMAAPERQIEAAEIRRRLGINENGGDDDVPGFYL